MNPYTKGALFVIRLIAFGLIVLSAVYLGSYLFYWMAHKKIADGIFLRFLKSLPLIFGLVLLLKARAIAEKLTEDL